MIDDLYCRGLNLKLVLSNLFNVMADTCKKESFLSLAFNPVLWAGSIDLEVLGKQTFNSVKLRKRNYTLCNCWRKLSEMF